MERRAKIFFVGGASASGKSTATRKLEQEFSVPRLELDAIYNRLAFLTGPGDPRGDAMKAVTAALLRELVKSGADLIVEGGWMWPDVATSLVRESDGQFSAAFCGYPNTSSASRLALIHSHTGDKHWLASKPDTEAISWLDRQISGSGEYKAAAEMAGLPFVDFSVPETGSQQLMQVYRDWRHSL